jgi:DNA-binding NtrC family response regulator
VSGLSANIAIVHDEPAFLDRATAALRRAGFNVAPFADPIEALKRIEAAQDVDGLVTRVTFPEGKPHGVSLALMLRTKRRGLKVVFVGRAHRIEHTGRIGELVPHPVDLERLVQAVERAVVGGFGEAVAPNTRPWRATREKPAGGRGSVKPALRDYWERLTADHGEHKPVR